MGLNGKSFEIIKFRSMVTDAEKEGAVFAKKNVILVSSPLANRGGRVMSEI